MKDARAASRHLITALTPVFIDEKAEVSIQIRIAANSYKLYDTHALSKHQEFLLRAAIKEFLEAVHDLPMMDLVEPEINIDMGGPRSSVITITFNQKDPDSLGFEWDQDFGKAADLLTKMFERLDAVARHSPHEGEVIEYCVLHEDIQDYYVTVRARTPRQAAHIFIACKAHNAPFKATLSSIKNVMLKIPRAQWA